MLRSQQNLDQVTLITSTINSIGRGNAIRRFIEFHKKLEVRILVCSDDNEEFKEYLDEKVKFIECSKDDSIFIKLSNLLDSVETPYVAWVADDDFILSKMLEASCKALNQNPNICACDGLTIFLSEKKAQRVNLTYSYRQYKVLKKLSDCAYTDQILRYIHQAENFHPMVLHGVIKSDVFRSILAEVDDIPIRWFDNFSIAQILTQGEIFMHPFLCSVRSSGTRTIDRFPQLYKSRQIKKSDILFDNIYREKIYKHISKNLELTAELKGAIDYFFLRTSTALNNNQPSPQFLKIIIIQWTKLQSILEIIKIKLKYRGIKNELDEIKNLMKKYPI